MRPTRVNPLTDASGPRTNARACWVDNFKQAPQAH